MIARLSGRLRLTLPLLLTFLSGAPSNTVAVFMAYIVSAGVGQLARLLDFLKLLLFLLVAKANNARRQRLFSIERKRFAFACLIKINILIERRFL